MAKDRPEWQKKCTFLNPQQAGVEVDILGETVKFYPVSVGKLFELRAIAQPLAKSLMSLMTDTTNDSGVHRSTNEEGGLEEAIMPPSPELVEARARMQSQAIDGMVETFTSKENLAIVGGVLVDSLRDIFEPGADDNPPGVEFINSLDAPLLPLFLKGLVKANKGVLGDFAGKTTGLLDGVLGKVKARTDAIARDETQQKKPNETPREQSETG